MGLNEQMEKFTELLTSLVPEDKQEKVVAGVQALADQIRGKAHDEIKEEFAETAEQIDNLIEQRDEAIRRAQDAEGKLQEERENAAKIIDEAKEALVSEHAELVESLEAKLADAEIEKDEIASRIAEQYEELRVSDRKKIISKVDEFFQTKTDAIRQKVEESASLSVDNFKEAAVLDQIVKIIRDHQIDANGDTINDAATEKLQETLAANKALVRQLEARNTRFAAEVEMLREKLNESGTDTDDEQPEEEQVNENANDEVVKTEVKKSGSRASELLREAFTSEGDSEGSDDDGWLDEEKAEKSRENRLRIAESLSGRGIVIDESDVLKETISTPAKEPVKQSNTDSFLIDDLTINEARVLSGLPNQG